jgi:hypothetical protein
MKKLIDLLIRSFLIILSLGIFLKYMIVPWIDDTNYFISILSTLIGGIFISIAFYFILFGKFVNTEKK